MAKVYAPGENTFTIKEVFKPEGGDGYLSSLPMEAAEVITITPMIPEAEPETPWWENITWFMEGLFA